MGFPVVIISSSFFCEVLHHVSDLFLLFHAQSQKCREEIFMSDRVLCMHISWNILFAGLANGSVTCYDLKVS